MSLFHGLEETRRTKVGNGAVYIKRVKYCAAHDWIDLFNCGGQSGWEAAHGNCGVTEHVHALHLKHTPKKAA